MADLTDEQMRENLEANLDDLTGPPITIRRCEVRDGRRYLDGVDVGPAIQEALTPQAKSAAARGAKRRGRRR